MGHRLGIYNNFRREAVLKTDNNSTNNKRLMINNCQSNKSNTSFGGGFGDSLTKANKWLNDGNYVKGFLILDTGGFILPRIFQAFLRNKEELGGYNYKAATEEAIREFLSGPGIFAVPLSCILLAKNQMGSATNVANNALDILSDKFESMPKEEIKTEFGTTKKNFYKRIINDAFNTHLIEDTDSQKVVNEITDKIIELDTKQGEYNKNGFFTKLNFKNPEIKKLKETISGIKSDITEMVVGLNNKHGKFANDKATIGFGKKGEFNIINFADYMSSYTNDIVKEVCIDNKSANKAELIQKLNTRAKGGKTVLNLTAIAITAAFTYCVPMLYKRNKTYPGTEGLVDKSNPASQPSKQEAK